MGQNSFSYKTIPTEIIFHQLLLNPDQYYSSFQKPAERLVWSAAQNRSLAWYSIGEECDSIIQNLTSIPTLKELDIYNDHTPIK